LSSGGALAGVTLGALTAAAGWGWAILLIAFFVSANILSRYQAERKDAAFGEVVEKGRERDTWQVVANGGVFALTAAASLLYPSPAWLPVAAGSVSASTADTWATEIGTLSSSPPRSITSGKPVPPGTSGGVTRLGMFGALAGSTFIAVLSLLVGWGYRAAAGALIGGIIGSIADSLAGATVQRRRWCDECNKSTERAVHACGTKTRLVGGIRWIDNDAVNAICSIAGAIVGATLLL
jgi:uncharacterized protein (TIGR00297 family)